MAKAPNFYKTEIRDFHTPKLFKKYFLLKVQTLKFLKKGQNFSPHYNKPTQISFQSVLIKSINSTHPIKITDHFKYLC